MKMIPIQPTYEHSVSSVKSKSLFMFLFPSGEMSPSLGPLHSTFFKVYVRFHCLQSLHVSRLWLQLTSIAFLDCSTWTVSPTWGTYSYSVSYFYSIFLCVRLCFFNKTQVLKKIRACFFCCFVLPTKYSSVLRAGAAQFVENIKTLSKEPETKS